MGEGYVNRILGKLNEDDYKIYHDIYVPTKEGG